MRQAAAMQRPKANSVSLADTESPVKRFIKSNMIVIGGAVILVVGVCVAAALATWSTNDPSLNHATNAEINNALGQTGAIVADVLMQTIGLATAVFLVPIFIWGWRLSLKYTSGVTRKRFLTWFLGTCCLQVVWPLFRFRQVGQFRPGSVASLAIGFSPFPPRSCLSSQPA